MDKQQMYRPPQFTSMPRPSFGNKMVIPEKKPNEETSSKLFLVVSEGNPLKIKEFLLSNHVNMNIRNDAGESILHTIIKNSNIASPVKLELVEFALNKGAQAMAFDKSNITPLHLACKLQLPKIVMLLLKNGASAKSLDNQQRTPLHYAVIGESTSCSESDKIKPLIPTKSNKTEKKIKSTNVENIYKLLDQFIYEDKHTKMYLEHIKQCINNADNMFPFELHDLTNKIKSTVSAIIVDKTLDDENKKKIMFEKVADSKHIINDMIIQKFSDVIVPLDIKPNTVDGWSPQSTEDNILPQNMVLADKSHLNIGLSMFETVNKEQMKAITEFDASLDKIYGGINSIKKYSNAVEDVIKNLHIITILIGKSLDKNKIMSQLHKVDAEADSYKKNFFLIIGKNFFLSNYAETIPLPLIKHSVSYDPKEGKIKYSDNTTLNKTNDLRCIRPLDDDRLLVRDTSSEKIPALASLYGKQYKKPDNKLLSEATKISDLKLAIFTDFLVSFLKTIKYDCNESNSYFSVISVDFIRDMVDFDPAIGGKKFSTND
jgi:hypothetical protein